MMFSLSVFRQGPRSLRAAAAASCVPEMPRVYFATSKTTTEPPKKELVSTMDLAKIVAKKHNMSQKDAKAILDTITDAISESLKDGKSVRFVNVGTFVTQMSAARTGVNPQTLQPLEIEAKERVKFRVSSVLKKLVEGE